MSRLFNCNSRVWCCQMQRRPTSTKRNPRLHYWNFRSHCLCDTLHFDFTTGPGSNFVQWIMVVLPRLVFFPLPADGSCHACRSRHYCVQHEEYSAVKALVSEIPQGNRDIMRKTKLRDIKAIGSLPQEVRGKELMIDILLSICCTAASAAAAAATFPYAVSVVIVVVGAASAIVVALSCYCSRDGGITVAFPTAAISRIAGMIKQGLLEKGYCTV